MNNLLLPYAMDFASHLIDGLNEHGVLSIKEIILFGSAARDEATRESDVDIFINLSGRKKAEENSIERRVQAAIETFYDGSSYKKRWKLLGVKNEIKCIIGRLDEWKDLKPSIISDGIILYGKYTGVVKGKSFVIVSWDKVSPEAKRVLLSKKIYGYNMNNKRYTGAIDGTLTVKLGSNCLMVPLDSSKKVLSVFNELGVNVKKFHMSSIV